MFRSMGNEFEKGNSASDFLFFKTGKVMVRISTPAQIPLTKLRSENDHLTGPSVLPNVSRIGAYSPIRIRYRLLKCIATSSVLNTMF